MQAIDSAPRFLFTSLNTPCPTPPLSPPIDRGLTPRPAQKPPESDALIASLEDDAPGARTPRASQSHSPTLPTRVPRVVCGPLPVNAVNPGLAAPRNKSLTVIYANRPRPVAKGKKAQTSLLAALKSAKREVVEAAIQGLGEARTVFGVRYDNFAVVRAAASTPARLGCLKAILRALPDDDVCGLMRTHSSMLCDAAEAAGDIDYANWLICAFGNDALQYISER